MGKVSSITSSILFVGFLCIALLSTSGEADTLLYQGPCSKFPDCDKHCISTGFPKGGKCIPPVPGSPLTCYCIIPSQNI
ncbi:putative defensin-like protein 30 [Camellia lanceoleosa]|uniref:Defensin-like protein 30 n=1 Tax=Camellia lanceoleosa TaxID=1840588 RepID=A0ACC0F408_9ERIC|nr:putative defensin-like protein 30 [Camellia lanceoleosa]